MAANQNKSAWTPVMGLRRGLFWGFLTACGVGVLGMALARIIALPWIDFLDLGMGDYRLIYRVALILAAGFGFAFAVLAVCERAGGMTSIVFEVFAVVGAVLVGLGLGWLAVAQAHALAGEKVSLLMTAMLTTLPMTGGALIAAFLRRS